jgi:tRNA modification GTPase
MTTVDPVARPDSATPVSAGTIVAAITPAAGGSRAIIRLSGPEAHTTIERLLARDAHMPARSTTHVAPARLRLAPGVLLPILLTRWYAPRSFTGEDCVEVQFPGAPVLTRQLLALFASQPGVRAAGPGEFSARAFLNGRLTPDEAEGIAALIRATTDAQLAAARDLAQGVYGLRFAEIASELATLLALVEAGADFTDQEDVVPIAASVLDARLCHILNQCTRLVGEAGLVRTALPRVLLIGEPNAGKSTIFNAMVGRARAVASPLRGSTRDVLIETVDLARVGAITRSHLDGPANAPSVPIELGDLPGLDSVDAYPDSASAAAARAAAREAIARAQLLIWCDPTGVFDEAWLEQHAGVDRGAPGQDHAFILRVRTFADRAGLTSASVSHSDLTICGLVPTDAARLAHAIGAKLSCSDATTNQPPSARAAVDAFSAVLPRHQSAIARVAGHLNAARAQVAASVSMLQTELVAQELRAALDASAELVGRIDPDDILGRIFSTFCVGK